MKKLIGVIGSGNIGRDPFDRRSWSGSARYFFKACSKAGILKKACGIEVPWLRRYGLMLKSISFDKSVWREKFYLDVRYFDALTKSIQKGIQTSDYQNDFIQIGGIYDVPSLVSGKAKCYSYHDGNLAQNIKSPFFNPKISGKIIESALQYERRVYKGMDKIFTMSEYLKKSFIEDFGISEERVINIGAGVNLDTIPSCVSDKDFCQKKALFIGVDFYRKGGPQLLQAFRIVNERYPDASLTIIGPRKLEIGQKFARGVKCLGFLSRSDPIQKEQFENILGESTLFVMPSLYEPFGIAPLEAMVYEIPCLLTNRWAFPEMVNPGENGELVECGNVEELAEKMIVLFSDPNKLYAMGKRGRRKVLENFVWETVVGRLAAGIE